MMAPLLPSPAQTPAHMCNHSNNAKMSARQQPLLSRINKQILQLKLSIQ